MKNKMFMLDELQQEELFAEELLRASCPSRDDVEHLKLTGLEILGFLAMKIVIPIVCSFVSRVLYDRYKDIQTKSQAEQAHKEIIELQTIDVNRVDEQTVVEEITTRLVAEGIPEDRARSIVSSSFNRVKQITLS